MWNMKEKWWNAKNGFWIEMLIYAGMFLFFAFAGIRLGLKNGIKIMLAINLYCIIKVFIGLKFKNIRQLLEKYDMRFVRIILVIYAVFALFTGRY